MVIRGLFTWGERFKGNALMMPDCKPPKLDDVDFSAIWSGKHSVTGSRAVWDERIKKVVNSFESCRVEFLIQFAIDTIHSGKGQAWRREEAARATLAYYKPPPKKWTRGKDVESNIHLAVRTMVAFLLEWLEERERLYLIAV